MPRGRRSAEYQAFRFLVKAGYKGYLKGRAGVKRYKATTKARRFQKANTIKAIVRSNLPEAVKQREVAKLSGITSQTKFKSAFFKFRRTPREVRQATEANF